MRAQPSPLERERGSKFVNRAWETFQNGSVDWTTIFSWNEFWGLSPQNFDTSFAQMAHFINKIWVQHLCFLIISPFSHSLSISSFSLHFLSISSFSLHFLFISSFSLHFLAARLQGCNDSCSPAINTAYHTPLLFWYPAISWQKRNSKEELGILNTLLGNFPKKCLFWACFELNYFCCK